MARSLVLLACSLIKKQNKKTVYDYVFGPAGICHVTENVDDYVLDLAGMSCNGKPVDD